MSRRRMGVVVLVIAEMTGSAGGMTERRLAIRQREFPYDGRVCHAIDEYTLRHADSPCNMQVCHTIDGSTLLRADPPCDRAASGAGATGAAIDRCEPGATRPGYSMGGFSPCQGKA